MKQKKLLSKPKQKIVVSKLKPEISKVLFIGAMIAMVVVVYLVFSPGIKNGITVWDDDKYVSENADIQSLSKANIKGFFTKYYEGNYQPLTILSYAVDYKFSKLDPSGYHTTNNLFHVINTLLVFILALFLFNLFENIELKFSATTLRNFLSALVVALLFALHPFHVESVAWISGRKDVLFGFFFLLSLILYLLYCANQRILLLILSFVFYVCSILSKGMAIPLAITLVAVDYLLSRKLLSRAVILEKVPFFIAGLFFGILALNAQIIGGGLSDFVEYNLAMRCFIACQSIILYLFKFLVPVNFSTFYPYPLEIPVYYYFAPVFITGAVFAIWKFFRNNRFIIFGLLVFLLNILMVLQVVAVGRAIIADRYTYISSFGIFLLAGYGVSRCLDYSKNTLKTNYVTKVLLILLPIYFAGLGYLTIRRIEVWKDDLSLWEDAIKKDPGNMSAYLFRGDARIKLQQYKGALADYNIYMNYNQNHAKAFNNRAVAKKELGDLQGALVDYNRALLLDSNYIDVYSNRGGIKFALKDYQGAMDDYNKAVSKSNNYAVYFNRGLLRRTIGDTLGSISDFETSIQLNPNFVGAYDNLSKILLVSGDLKKALPVCQKLIEIKPEASVYGHIGYIYYRWGDYKKSIEAYTNAINLNPRESQYYSDRGTIKILDNEYESAIVDYDVLLKINSKDAAALFNRGICKAKTGKNADGCNDLHASLALGYMEAQRKIAELCR